MSLRWVSRSRVAPTSRSLPSTSVHCSNGRLVVTATLVRSYAVLITSKSNSAPTLLAGTYPNSSRTSKSSRANWAFTRNSTRSSRASSNWVTNSVTRQNRTFFPRRHASPANAVATCVLPVPGLPIRDHRLPPVDELAPHQLGDQHLVQGRLGGEVEVLQRLQRREPRRLQPPLGRPLLPVQELQFGQLEKEAEVIDVVRGAPLGHLLALGQYRRRTQRLQVVLQEDRAGGLGLLHDTPPARRAW